MQRSVRGGAGGGGGRVGVLVVNLKVFSMFRHRYKELSLINRRKKELLYLEYLYVFRTWYIKSANTNAYI